MSGAQHTALILQKQDTGEAWSSANAHFSAAFTLSTPGLEKIMPWLQLCHHSVPAAVVNPKLTLPASLSTLNPHANIASLSQDLQPQAEKQLII